MFSTMKNNRSLSFYQQSAVITSVTTAGVASQAAQITAGLHGQIAGLQSQINVFQTQIVSFQELIPGFQLQIDQYNTQLNDVLATLSNERNAVLQRLTERLSADPSYVGMRNDGVVLARKYEQAEISMGGSGEGNYTSAQRQELLEHGKVRNFEGHHINSVADNPELQANPDNVTMLEEHRGGGGVRRHYERHGQNWKNQTQGELLDRDQRLRDTNQRRVDVEEGKIAQTESDITQTKEDITQSETDIAKAKKDIPRNELKGLGIAIAIGLGVGVAIGFAVTLARSGVSPESLKLAALEGAKGGIEAGALAAVGYGIGRTIGEVASKAVEGVFKNLGLAITDNITKMVSMGVVGTLTIAVFSAYQFIKLKQQGVGTREALLKTGRQAMFSLSLLAVSIAVQGTWGGPAGIIVSMSIGIIMVSYTVIDSVQQRQFAEKIRVYTIDKCRPTFSY